AGTVAFGIPEHHAVLEFAHPHAVAPRAGLRIAGRSGERIPEVTNAASTVVVLVKPPAVGRRLHVVDARVGHVVPIVHESRGEAVALTLPSRRPRRGLPG